MPHQDSPSPIEPSVMIDSIPSTNSLSRASPSAPLHSPSHKGSSHKLHRAHTGHGRLPHARNPSFGKNLNKLSKLTATHANESNPIRLPTKPKTQAASSSPSTQQVKRDSSNANLPRTGSKVSVKKNTSNVSLKRNGSAVQLSRHARPETPLRRVHPKPGNIDYQVSKPTARFSVGSDEDGDGDGEDADWTEESRSHSQSPSTTRRNSVTRGLHESKQMPPEDMTLSRAQVNLPDSPPESPSTTTSSEEDTEARDHHHIFHHPHPPNNDAIRPRRISQRPSKYTPPQVSSASANGTNPKTNNSVNLDSKDSTLNNPSMPESGVSRFLQSTGSSGSPNPTAALGKVHTAINSQGAKPTTRTRPPSPEPSTDAVRRAKSVGNLIPSATTTDPIPISSSPPSYTVGPLPKRPGGNTQAKLDLWRSRTHIETSPGPPSVHIAGHSSSSMTATFQGMQERRIRLWEGAEGEMGHLRRFRNPVLEGVGRVLGKGECKKERERERERERGRGAGERRGERPTSAAGRVVIGRREQEREREREREKEKERERERRGGRAIGVGNGISNGNGVDDNDDEGDAEERQRLQELLRRMWEGPLGLEGGIDG